jgi:cytochrome c peroxidase
LEQVLNHYQNGVRNNPNLDPLLKKSDGSLGIDLTEEEKKNIIAFLKTLTDESFLKDERFSEFNNTIK